MVCPSGVTHAMTTGRGHHQSGEPRHHSDLMSYFLRRAYHRPHQVTPRVSPPGQCPLNRQPTTLVCHTTFSPTRKGMAATLREQPARSGAISARQPLTTLYCPRPFISIKNLIRIHSDPFQGFHYPQPVDAPSAITGGICFRTGHGQTG